MDLLLSNLKPSSKYFYTKIAQATVDIIPLSLAVVPWGILCGSLAIQSGLTPLQSQLLSLIVFAGAAQLASFSLLGSGNPMLPILTSTFVISSRHLLYSAVFQEHARGLPWVKRALLAFFLTDEMFAVTCADMEKNKRFSYAYALTSGVVFYLIWNVATYIGIVAGVSLDNLDDLGLEFAIAATFIAIVIPSIKNHSILVSVLVTGATVLILENLNVQHALILATIAGMISGYITAKREVSDEL